ncbi:hypothetical protein CKO25_03035 [Thiocapsa imhoffii]|uniref:Ni,Fe-hydrogenase I large subunit n=1 Tax=Thiocapsa imhoffii TaxID=382777 RepID=A0A9X0WFA8_9GAMM|nr:nickel-dependent hydrogenase large subunit [Thiocapsa imhoffii]MBK1643649.1 hypothetical protein [Thiocapsa imhoffii]
MTDPSGNLEIQVNRTAAGAQCWIRSTRPVHAASVFIGRTAAETSVRLPRLFSVCARAQAGACAAALEQARDCVASPLTQIRRERAIAVERGREHLWRILLDWPGLLGTAPARQDLRLVISETTRLLAALDAQGDLFHPGSEAPAELARQAVFDAAASALEAQLTRSLFGVAPTRWLDEVIDATRFEHWCRVTDGVAAPLLRHLIDANEAGLGPTDIAVLPDLPDRTLLEALTGPGAAHFVARPTWHGVARETSPYARMREHPLIASLLGRFGCGLLVRLTAALLEVATSFVAGTGPDQAPAPPPAQVNPPGTGVGIGRTQAARGLLVHLARLDQDRISDYRILAPTEWNFHPEGVVAAALTALPPAPDAAWRRRAELLITAIDPCVAFRLHLT